MSAGTLAGNPAEVNGLTCAEAARWYLGRGLRPIPWVAGADGRKRVTLRGFTYRDYAPALVDLDGWDEGWQVGLALAEPGGVFAVDVDAYDQLRAWEARGWAGLARSWRQVSGRAGGGEHHLYRPGNGLTGWPRHGRLSAEFPGLEVISNGLLAASPSVHPSGRRYAWDPDRGGAVALVSPGLALELNARAEAPARDGAADGNGVRGDGGRPDVGALLRDGVRTGGHDDALRDLAWYAALDGRSREETALVWGQVVRATRGVDPDRPFTAADFDRHWASAVRKLREHAAVVVEPWMMDWVRSLQEVRRDLGDDAGEGERERRVRVQLEVIEVNAEAARRYAAAGYVAPAAGDGESLAAGLARPRRERPFLVDQLFGARHNASLVGQYKTGKTSLVGNLLRALVDDVPFLGRFETALPAGGRVGFWNCEMDPDDLLDYLRALGVTAAGARRVELLHLRGRRVPFLTSDAAAAWTRTWLREHDVAAWVTDSWGRLSAWNGVSERDNTAAGELWARVDALKAEAGVAAFLTTGHTGRGEVAEGEERMRGGTINDDWVDARWVYTREGDDRFLRAEGRGGVQLAATRVGWDRLTGIMTLGEPGGRAEAREARGLGEVAAVVAERAGELNQRDLIAAVRARRVPGLSDQNQVHDAVTAAEARGLVHWRPGGRTGTAHIYWPGPSPDAEVLRGLRRD